MQVDARFQDLARPVVHVVSTDTKRSLRWSSRALWWWKTPSHLMPQFGTSLLFTWSGEAGNGQSPALFTVSIPHLVLPKTTGRACTWDGNKQRLEGTQGGPKASYTSSGHWVSSSSPTPLWGAQAVPLPFTAPWQWGSARGSYQTDCPSAGALRALQWCHGQNQGQTPTAE